MNYEERILEDDYPVYASYWYIVEIKMWTTTTEPTRSHLTGTVKDLKKDLRYINDLPQHAEIVIKSCDVVGRRLPLS